MAYHPLLKDLAKWESEEHFYDQRYFWWSRFPRGKEKKVEELFNQDYIDFPTVSVDSETGKEIHEIRRAYFSENLGLGIKKEFQKLESGIEEKLIELEKTDQRNRFRSLLLEQLIKIHRKVTQLEIDHLYKCVIEEQFSENLELLKTTILAQEKNDKVTWKLKLFKDSNANDTDNDPFSNFFKRLKDEKLIEKNTHFSHFKQLFEGSRPNKKIVWKGNPAEIITLFTLLKNKEYISVHQQWKMLKECFSTQFPMDALRSGTPLTSKVEIKRMEEIVDELKNLQKKKKIKKLFCQGAKTLTYLNTCNGQMQVKKDVFS